MGKKLNDPIKNEQEIPNEVMEKLVHNRETILNQEIKQEKMTKKSYKKKIAASLILAAVIFFIVITKTPVGAAIENALGISRDSAVETVENSGIPNKIDLSSTQNGLEIKLTKFVSTKKKFAFDYQFRIDDEKLKILLEKEIKADSNFQDIQIGLFANGSTEDLFGGVTSMATFRMEGDTFYGSVVSTFNHDKIPENAKLTLHIYRLAWKDRDEYEAALAEAMANQGAPFSVETALAYEGDWRFAIDYEPLTQTADVAIRNVNNITDIKITNDALQTTAKFTAPISENMAPGIDIYKNGIKVDTPSFVYDLETGRMDISFDLSAMDKISVYKIQVNEVDQLSGEMPSEIDYFELQNK